MTCGADGTRKRQEAQEPAVSGSNDALSEVPSSHLDSPKCAELEPRRIESAAQDSDHSSLTVDQVADRLSLAIDRASQAGQWTVVERLAEQLERYQLRQIEAKADNVTRLRPPKKDSR